MDESAKAQRYEQRFPETGCSEGQKEERMERLDFKDEVRAGRRSNRNRGIVVPALPWLEPREASR